MSNRTRFAGQYRAVEFNYGGNGGDNPPALVVASGPGTTGSETLTVYGGVITLSDGTIVSVFNTNASVTIANAAGVDTVTPSAVSTNVFSNLYGPTATVTGTFTFAHYAGDRIASGTFGLQEALNYASLKGGGTVIIDAEWVTQGGTAAIVNAATIPVGVSLLDNRLAVGPVQSVTVPLTLAQIQGASTTAVQIIAAPGTGAMIDVIDAVVDLVFGTNAFAGGGAAQLSYGTAVTFPATATVAASVYTGLAANTIQKVAGVAAASTSSNYLNKAIYYNNATAAFTAGTGCSANIAVNYKVISGLS